MRLTFEDGVEATFDLLTLRQTCPCAGCRGKRDQGLAAYGGSEITATSAELHGNWGIAFRWSDGHDTGIYSWAHLRSWWDDRPS